MKPIRFLMIGGFLGAGKTTTISRLAQHYVDSGLDVGLVTNDQAYDLVDTQTLRAQGFDVGEVPGACFCCKFDDLIDTVSGLSESRTPDLVIAEPVGSCTDLFATVIQPMRELFGGVKRVVEESKYYREMVTHKSKAIIGEPTSLEIVHAHKGSIELVATSRGTAAHSSSRSGLNSNLAMIPFLAEIKAIHDETESDPKWQNTIFEPPTMSWNISIKDDAMAINVKASKSVCRVYFRTMPGIDESPLVERVRQSAEENGLDLEINRWGNSLMVDPDSDFVREALKLAHRPKSKTVSYGTDGGILTELEDKIVFGPGSIAQAHTRDEWIALEQLSLGTDMYAKMIRNWCC